jgi:hypothetical protein
MKQIKLVIALAVLLNIPMLASGQRHLDGTRHLEVTAGFVDHFRTGKQDNSGFYWNGSYSWFTKRITYWKVGYNGSIKYISSGPDLVNVNRHLVEGLIYLPILHNQGRDFFINVGIGPNVGYEFINNGRSTLTDGSIVLDDNSFLYGLAAGVDGEIFLSDRVVFLLSLKERWLPQSDLKKFHMNMGAGLKFMIRTR